MTKQSYKYLAEILLNNVKKLIVLSTLFVTIQIIIGGAFLIGYSNYINKQITYNINEYQEVDYNQLCIISECKKIITENKSYYNKNGILREGYSKKHDIIIQINNVNITSTLEFIIYNKESNAQFILNTIDIEHILLQIAFVITPVLLIFTIILLALTIKEEREISLRTLAGNEALLANKSMILITENIHHELNTPMEVIDNKTHRIQKIILEYLMKEYKNWEQYKSENGKIQENSFEMYKLKERRIFNRKMIKIEEDFEYIKQSSEQIYAVLERMRGFKHLRYSNGNKSIANIIEGAFKVISISNSNFKFSIDEKLRKYTIDSDTFKNADLLNILINHIKNSLEANSSKISIIFSKETKTEISFRLVDNGNGIKDKNKDNIFKPNFSTKDIGTSGLRGNGLYLNKSILKSVNGDVELVDSSKYGTTFEICLPAKKGKWEKLYS